MKRITMILAGTIAVATALKAPGQEPAPPAPQPPPPVVAGARPYGLFTPDRGATLVIPKGAAETGDIAQTEEDLNVMARILEKAANVGDDQGKAMGITIQNSIFGNTANPRNMYLEDYGAIFIMNVPYPLVPTDSGRPAEKEDTSASSEWDEARQELYAGSSTGFSVDVSKLIIPHLAPVQPYDEGKVEQLKSDLLSALKNAVHIRKLKPDEQVTVVVTGGGSAGGHRVISRSGSRGRSAVAVSQSSGPAQQSRMIIRAKRADIENFQKGKLDLDQFRKKVSITLS